MDEKNNDCAFILAQALNDLKTEKGDTFDINHVNLAELERRTNIPRGKLRGLQKHGFIETPRSSTGRPTGSKVLQGYTGVIDDLLRKGVKNSSVIYDRIKLLGYEGGKTVLKQYISTHKDLLPPKRQMVSPQGEPRKALHH